MKTTEVDKLIAGLEWESRRGHYTTENRMALLNELKALKQALKIDLVSKSLPTKEEVIAEGDKQIDDWLSENHYKEQRAYRVAFRRSYEYVLRFIK
tara:strand:- start:8277 stop:8564 length:288 start_codon:yes stop_codon:yes gene_type:complete